MKEKRSWGMRILAAALTAMMGMQLLPMSVFADETRGAAQKQAAQEERAGYSSNVPQEDPNAVVLGEDTERREVNVKHFRMSDGTSQAMVYSEPVHYTAADGSLKDIDNTLTEEKAKSAGDFTGYVNKANSFEVKFAKDLGEKYSFRIQQGDSALTWKFEASKARWLSRPASAKLKGEARARTMSKDEPYALKNISKGLVYENARPGVDLDYTMTGSGVKENIIVEKKQETYEYAFQVEAKNLTLKKQEDGSLTAEQGEKVVFRIPAPFLIDASGQSSQAVHYQVEQREKDWRVTIVADTDWMNAEDRQFPVTIDPVIQTETTRQAIESTFVTSQKPTESHASKLLLEVGRESAEYGVCRTYVKFDLPKLNKGDIIVNALLGMVQYYGDYYTDTTPASAVSAHIVTQSWVKEKMNWNNKASFYSKGMDFAYMSRSDKVSIQNPVQKRWDITRAVKAWYDGSLTNNGIMLKAQKEDGSYAETGVIGHFWSEKYNNVTNAYPMVALQYRNNKGLESYWDYSTFGAGRAGTASVCNYTGNLVFSHADAQTAGLRMPVTMAHVYNGYMAGANYAAMLPYTGHGWKLSMQQSLRPSSQYGLTGQAAKDYPYVYGDGDGTEHYFKAVTKDGKTKYLDEDGLGLELTILPTADPKYQVKDDKDNVMTFNKSGNLYTMKDPNSNQLMVNYISPSNQSIKSITDGAGKQIQIGEHESGNRYVRSITDPAGRVTYYYYNGPKLGQINYPDGTHSEYYYDNDGALIRVKNNEGYELNFEYTALAKGKRVSKVTEKTPEGTGQVVTYDYTYYNKTVMRTSGQDGVYGNADDIITTMLFDNAGRLTSTEAACNGKSLGAAGASYTASKPNGDNSNIKQLNRVTRVLSQGKSVENLLENGSMERSGNWPGTSWNGTASFGAYYSPEDAYLGKQSLKIECTGLVEVHAGARDSQSVSGLKENTTYTLSAYVKTKNVKQVRELCGACLMVSCGGKDNWSEFVAGTTDTEINKGWQRISVTFTTPAGVTSANCNLMIRECTGIAYFDAVQLEEGDTANLFNMVENSSFEKKASNYWNFINMNYSSGADYDVTENKKDGAKSFRVQGVPNTQKVLYQKIPVTGTEDDTYILSGWATADSVPDMFNPDSYYDLLAEVYYSDGSMKQKEPIKFNSVADPWQYACGAFNLDDGDTGKTRTPVELRVYFRYSREINTAYFDSMQLVKDAAPSYTYDKDGNLVTVAANAEQNSKMEYSNSNLTSATDPKGFKYEYKYDDKHNMTQAKSQRGVLNNYTYDANGNPTQYVIQNASGSERLQSNTEYTANGAFVSKVTDQNGYATTYDYNQNTGVLNNVTDALGNKVEYTYDPNNDRQQSVSQKLKNGGEVKNSYTYNKDELSSISHNGFKYLFEYDSFGNVIETKVGNQILSKDTYRPNNGDLLKTTFGNGTVLSYNYDNYGNITSTERSGIKDFTWKYNSSGYANRHDDLVNNLQYDYNYDTTGRLIRQNVRDLSKSATSYRELYRSEYQYNNDNNISKFVNQAGGRTTVEKFEYGQDNLPTKYVMPNGIERTWSYGPINRPYQGRINTTVPIQLETLYHLSKRNGENQSDFRTMQIYQETIGAHQYQYQYDKLGNIVDIRENIGGNYVVKCTYEYDELGQLIRENSLYTGQTMVYTYDNGGNIIQKKQYPCSFGELGTATKTIDYGYGDENWKDKMTSYDGQAVTYDAIGNPLSYRGYTLGWQNGQELKSLSGNGVTSSYKYDSEGIRTEKVVNGVRTTYYYVGDQLTYEKRGEAELYYFYDNDGTITGLRYVKNGTATDYVLTTNFRGDVESIYSTNGTELAHYTYDVWGNVISIKDANGNAITDKDSIAHVNPFRYRGYYLDSETGFYYLKSRYYDPQTHRMLNADEDSLSASTPEGLLDKNYFAYCDNNPVIRADGDGEFWHIVAGAVVGAVVGGVTSAISQGFADGKVDLKKVAIDSMIGAIGGGCAATGIPVVGQMAIGAALGGAGNIAGQLFDGKSLKNVDYGDALVSATVGAAAGAAGGRGANHYNQNMMRSGKQVTKRVCSSASKGGVKEAKRAIKTYKKNTKLTYIELKKGLTKSSVVSATHSIGSSIKKGWNNVKNWASRTTNRIKGWFR